MSEPSFETTARGFRHYDPLATTYGHEVRVYESSSASGPHLWLAVHLTAEMARKAGSNISPCDARAHLSVAQAEELIARLRAAIDGHYQTRRDDA